MLARVAFKSFSTHLKQFSTLDPDVMNGAKPATVYNLINGIWRTSEQIRTIVDPMNGEPFLKVPHSSDYDLNEVAKFMKACPKTGLHNPLKNVERYLLYGNVCRKAAELMFHSDIEYFFTRLIQRVMPKSFEQALGEVKVTRNFLANFAGDNVRYLAHSFQYPGDRFGQRCTSYRWPYGPVCIISPFNFPLEIPALQLMGALFMGNKVVLKPNFQTAVVIEQFLRLLHYCGMPTTDVEFLNVSGAEFERFFSLVDIRMTQFTGSSKVAERLGQVLRGKIKIEDSGYDWKVMGPDASESYADYLAYQSDQDSYSASGQKCSKQSLLMMHKNWHKYDFFQRMTDFAKRRNIHDLTVGPTLSVKNEDYESIISDLLKIPDTKILFGGNPLKDHKIPSCYGAWEPTAVYVPIEAFRNPKYFKLITSEVFGPFQIVTDFDDMQVELVLEILENIPLHLSAGVVSNDIPFRNKVLSNSCNGTTYVGLRARTTGAPQNHWFGPCSDPRAAGIGTKEAIQMVWSCHREIVIDEDVPKYGIKIPKTT